MAISVKNRPNAQTHANTTTDGRGAAKSRVRTSFSSVMGHTKGVADGGGFGRQVQEQGQRRAVRHTRPQQKKNITKEQATRLAKYAPMIMSSAKRNNVPVPLVAAVILQESGAQAKAVSPAGAKGLMQLMPGTARRFGVRDIMDPAQNIEGGTKYLRFLMDRYNGRMDLALAGYNAGEHNVDKHGGIPPFAETRNYVPSVLAYADTLYHIFRGTERMQTVASAVTIPANARKV